MPSQVEQRRIGAAGPIDPNLEYHLKNEDTPLHHKLNNLDAVARLVMAVAHTSTAKAPETTLDPAQKLRQVVQVNIGTGIKTVAVTRSGNNLLVAQNGIFGDLKGTARTDLELKLRSHVMDELGAHSTIQSVTFINGAYDDYGKHAEMALVEHCIANRVPMTGGTVGVSKPCCKHCSQELARNGVDFSLWVDKEVPKWEAVVGDRANLRLEADPEGFAWRDLRLEAAAEDAAAATAKVVPEKPAASGLVGGSTGSNPSSNEKKVVG